MVRLLGSLRCADRFLRRSTSIACRAVALTLSPSLDVFCRIAAVSLSTCILLCTPTTYPLAPASALPSATLSFCSTSVLPPGSTSASAGSFDPAWGSFGLHAPHSPSPATPCYTLRSRV
ncbi:hypothetical protein OG21DRAFT_604703 [Imleria badia]|nr:hypothetical protein OG21DRAFT_604703 [Imleria badia]